MRRLAALALLAAVVAGCGREHPGALAIRECLYAKGVTSVHLTSVNAAPPGVRDDWTGVTVITFGRRLPAAAFFPGRVTSEVVSVGGAVVVARSDRDASRIRRELVDEAGHSGIPFRRIGSNVLFSPTGFGAGCL